MVRVSRVIRVIFALCLLGATYNHLRIILEHGIMWDYGFGSRVLPGSWAYWAALTLFDPLAAILLLFRPRIGLWLTIVIIVSDVLHNTYYVAITGKWVNFFYVSQVGFLFMVLCLTPVAFRGLQEDRENLIIRDA